ncbi:hypothetical protein KI387_014344, partial [Taxus chinensis]
NLVQVSQYFAFRGLGSHPSRGVSDCEKKGMKERIKKEQVRREKRNEFQSRK